MPRVACTLTIFFCCWGWYRSNCCWSTGYFFPQHPKQQQQQQYANPHSSPFLAVVTEPDSCSNYQRFQETVTAVEGAIRTGCISLVCIRLGQEQPYDSDLLDQLCLRIKHLVHHQEDLTNTTPCSIVVNVNDTSSSFQIATRNGLHGIHVKERDIETIPNLRQQNVVWIGASAHTVKSAIQAAQYGANYLFVGTCFETQSHPEKVQSMASTDVRIQQHQLEGPELPGQVQQELHKLGHPYNTIPVFAIGGIQEQNCIIPIRAGASGIAVMRSILCSSDPYQTTLNLHNKIKNG